MKWIAKANILASAAYGLAGILGTHLWAADTDAAAYEAELIFPLETWHNHASCIVEAP